jgi:hypothetical protein
MRDSSAQVIGIGVLAGCDVVEEEGTAMAVVLYLAAGFP